MKKLILSITALSIITGAVVFANGSKNENCTKNNNNACCKVTPDCKPGDAHCVCPDFSK